MAAALWLRDKMEKTAIASLSTITAAKQPYLFHSSVIRNIIVVTNNSYQITKLFIIHISFLRVTFNVLHSLLYIYNVD